MECEDVNDDEGQGAPLERGVDVSVHWCCVEDRACWGLFIVLVRSRLTHSMLHVTRYI